MKKGIFLGLAICAILVGFSVLHKSRNIEIQAKDSSFAGKNAPSSITVDTLEPAPGKVAKQPAEDSDLMDFIKKLVSSKLTEQTALKLLESGISQNKKAVVLETFNEMGGAYTDQRWPNLLRDLLLNSNEWPEMANKASKSLAIVNASGEMDGLLLHDFQSLRADEIVKRSALADAFSGRGAVESAMAEAGSEAEIKILSSKHAELLSQAERLQSFETSKAEVARVQYLNKYISSASSLEELATGINKGTQDPNIKNESKPDFVLAASESKISGKSDMLFDYWKKMLPQAETQADFIGVLNLAVQQAAYSETDKRHAEHIMQWLLGQTGLDPRNSNDPRIELSIAMVNACTDKFVKKDLCPSLQDIRKSLQAKLSKEGFQSYITEN